MENRPDTNQKAKLKTNRNTLGATLFAVVMLIIAAFVAGLSYYYLVMRPNIIASYNFNDKGLVSMRVEPSYKANIKLDMKAINDLGSIPGVMAISPLQFYPANTSLDTNTGEAIVYGIKSDYLAFEDITIISGRSTFSNSDAAETIVSTGTLKALKADVSEMLGENITYNLIKLDDGGSVEARFPYVLKIAGIVKDDNTKLAYMPLDIVDKSNGTSYNEARLTVGKRDDMARVRGIVEAKGYPTLSAYDSYQQVLEMTKNPFLYYNYQSMLSN